MGKTTLNNASNLPWPALDDRNEHGDCLLTLISDSSEKSHCTFAPTGHHSKL